MGKPRPVERRRGILRRDLNDFVRGPDGAVSEAKAFSIAGKVVCLYLLLWWTSEVMHTEWTLTTLLSFLIAPDLVKAAIKARVAPK